jgi:hypothetical protein
MSGERRLDAHISRDLACVGRLNESASEVSNIQRSRPSHTRLGSRFILMFAPVMRGLTRGGRAGSQRRHNGRALTDFSVQVLYLIAGDNEVSVGMRVFTPSGCFSPVTQIEKRNVFMITVAPAERGTATKAKFAIVESRPALHHLNI